MMKTTRFFKQAGIGLLELMLSLAIIAILLIMATRYYQSANTTQSINSAVEMVNAVKSATKNYMNSNPTKLPLITELQTGGYLPDTYAKPSMANPWSGGVCVAAAAATTCPTTAADLGTATTYTVILTSVPAGICTEVAGRINGNDTVELGESATCATTTVVAIFAL